MAPFWLLEDICHYFPRCQEDYGDPRGGAGRPSTRVVPSTLQFLRQPHYALATLCIVVVFALTFATIKTDVYVSIRHESRGYARSHRSAAKPHPRRRRSDVSASQPTSLSCAWVNPPQQQLLARLHPWLRGPPGIVKIPQGFFSFPKGASSKALRFQTDHPPTSPPEGLAQLYGPAQVLQDQVLATGNATGEDPGGSRAEKCDSSSPKLTEDSYDDNTPSGYSPWTLLLPLASSTTPHCY
ncbi:hypothetical protein V5799_022017 [Amblyomma americanum]|uniref:Uncharacterized protein n=1 Tax=Amblyomma americanum TaxID=6943 RepID=A0AAQ4FNA7_AMBAM